MNPNVFNKSGAVTELFRILNSKSINRFSSIGEIIDYKRNYLDEIENFKAKVKNRIIEEIKNLHEENQNLHEEYNKRKIEQTLLVNTQMDELSAILLSSHNGLFSKIKKRKARKKLELLEYNYQQIIAEPLHPYVREIESNERQIDRLTNKQSDEIEHRAWDFIKEVKRIIYELDNNAPLIYGCVGELKAIELLKNLPDEYYIINDFQESFHKPLFFKSENDWIYSTQLDHIVVGPTGVHVIETKYWSRKSIESNDLFSPIKQLRRGGFALYCILNEAARNSRLFSSNWGSIEISVSRILLMMNMSTDKQYQYVKILSKHNCLDYITHKPVVLDKAQIKYIVNRLSYNLDQLS